jgi:hypothetical protein
MISRPVHPLLLGALPVASMYAAYPGRSNLDELGTAFLAALAAAGTIWMVLSLAYRDATKAALLASALLLLPVLPDLLHWLEESSLARFGLARRRYVFGALLLAYAALAFWLARTRVSLARGTAVANIVAAGLVLPPLGALAAFNVTTLDARMRSGPPVPVPTASAVASEKPDIYYFIFDRYGDAATLRENGLDNEPLYRFLENRGFYVARESRANYIKTALSVSSSLNLAYHDDLARDPGPDSGNHLPLNYRLQHHVAGTFLKAQGYRYIHAGSWWWPTATTPLADETINSYIAVPQPVVLLLKQPLVAPLVSPFHTALLDHRLQQWERVHRQVTELESLIRRSEPKFVFVHMLVPHPPTVFDEDGSYVSEDLESRRPGDENYRRQVVMVNGIIRSLVDRILQNAATPPVIILQGDEGPYPKGLEGSDEYRYRRLTPAQLRYRSGILNAYYLPRGGSALYPSISPVNSFRIVFNSYFGTNLPLLPDRVYRHDSERRPYALADVTADVRGRAELAGPTPAGSPGLSPVRLASRP